MKRWFYTVVAALVAASLVNALMRNWLVSAAGLVAAALMFRKGLQAQREGP